MVALPKTLDEKIAFRADHLVAYQGKRLAKRYRKLVDGIADPRLNEAVAKGYHKLLAYKDEYEVARLLLESRGQGASGVRRRFEADLSPCAADAVEDRPGWAPEEARVRDVDRSGCSGCWRG